MYDYYFIHTANFIPYCCQKHIGLDTIILFTKEMELTHFGQLKIPMKSSINLSRKALRVLRAAACDCGTPWTFLLPFFYIVYI